MRGEWCKLHHLRWIFEKMHRMFKWLLLGWRSLYYFKLQRNEYRENCLCHMQQWILFKFSRMWCLSLHNHWSRWNLFLMQFRIRIEQRKSLWAQKLQAISSRHFFMFKVQRKLYFNFWSLRSAKLWNYQSIRCSCMWSVYSSSCQRRGWMRRRSSQMQHL